MSSKRVLYWGSGSVPCWRVMVVLAEKNLEYESKLISFSNREHKSQEVFSLNARGQVPTFKDGPNIVNESAAALLYLEKQYPEPILMPSHLTAQVLQRLEECNVTFPPLNAGILRTKADSPEFAEKVEAVKKELTFWESYLKEGKYVVGNEFTLADIALAPWLLFFERQGATYKDYPRLAAYAAAVKERPSIKNTWPPHWLETPNNSKLTAYM